MSTERRTRLATRTTAVLDHELLGVDSHRTRLTIAGLAVLVAMILVSYAGTVISVNGGPLETQTSLFDTLSSVIILLVTAAVTVAPLVYGAWNGGPVLAFAIPLVPIGVGHLIAGQFVLGVDAAIALTVGATGGTLALYAADVRETGTLRPWRTRAIDEDRLLIVTVGAAIALFSIVSFVQTVPGHVQEWYAPFEVLWLVPVAIVSTYWGAWLRLSVRRRRDRRSVEQ